MLRACFPAGTVTGAPKVRAMEIIDELEPIKGAMPALWDISLFREYGYMYHDKNAYNKRREGLCSGRRRGSS